MVTGFLAARLVDRTCAPVGVGIDGVADAWLYAACPSPLGSKIILVADCVQNESYRVVGTYSCQGHHVGSSGTPPQNIAQQLGTERGWKWKGNSARISEVRTRSSAGRALD